ncbi:MAG: FkbM family methyltransferase [Pseudomonadota bacterium]
MRRKRDGIGQSIDVYYRDTARTQRMDRLNAQFISKGGLAFDIGAHIGDRTASFLRLGASVVALEPQPRVFRALRLIHGRAPRATLLCQAVGAELGQIDMYLNSKNPTISTASSDLVEAAKRSPNWKGQEWDAQVRVPMTTLDRLIACYGMPDFVKIDVEGYEAKALAGLSIPLPMLSFEFTTIQRDVAYACIDRLSEIGRFAFNVSLSEDHKLRHTDWISGNEMSAEIETLPEQANSGDIYARRLN